MKFAYYDDFKCTADKCEITCCREWDITVDDETQSKWNKLNMSAGMCDKDGRKVINFDENKYCPYLTENRLCSIVSDIGYENIPKACDVFPRQIHKYADRTEYALVSCCPEVIRLMDKCDIDKMASRILGKSGDELFNLRNRVMELLIESRNSSVGMLEAFFVLLNRDEKESFDKEFLMQLEDTILAMETNSINSFEEVNELFLDIVANYNAKGMYTEYLVDITKIAQTIDEFEELQIKEIVSEFKLKIEAYDELFKKYLLSELFADGILPDSENEELTIMLQWFSMELAIIRHALLLNYIMDAKSLNKNLVITYMVIVSRMMGYAKDDIYEYMEECFEEPLWEWGYMALILS